MTHAQRGVRVVRDQRGFTLIEVMVAAAIIFVAISALALAMGTGIEGIEFGRQQTTALFLAEEGAERVRAAVLLTTDLSTVTTGTFPAEAYGSITGAPKYRRAYTVSVASGGSVPDGSKLVDVNVFYRPVTARGVSTTERQTTLKMLLVKR